MKIQINGRWYKATEGETVLRVCRRNNIKVPALCAHRAVEPFGACRLCMVEITHENWGGWKGNVTACLYPVEDKLIVKTETPKVKELRRMVMNLLLARCPDSEIIRNMAEEYGISISDFPNRPNADDCILCTLCTRVCARMGFNAISIAGRGYDREVATPLREAPPDCVGCLACVNICPTDFIKYEDVGNKRKIWDREFELIETKDGTTITKAFAEHLIEHQGIPEDYFQSGDAEKRGAIAANMKKLVDWSKKKETDKEEVGK